MSLHQPAKAGDVQAMKAIVARGADVDGVDEWGCTALYWAANKGCMLGVAALLEAKASVDKDVAGSTPLHIASYNGHVDCVRVRSSFLHSVVGCEYD